MFLSFSRLRCRRSLPALIVSATSALRVLARDFNKAGGGWAPTRPLEPILQRNHSALIVCSGSVLPALRAGR